jgi:hypothetical protein
VGMIVAHVGGRKAAARELMRNAAGVGSAVPSNNELQRTRPAQAMEPRR